LKNNTQKISQQITKVFNELLNEYIHEDDNISSHDDIKEIPASAKINSDNEYKLINNFLNSPCLCGKLCKDRLNFEEIAKSLRG
jgi:hypothetical protein